ncbi:amidohydrolase family protein [Novosphingobium sp. 9]|uniref:amidohydrolase family protein n=1 Tax=Novosphingobium sp. 9 TaxID=2025349 RepID=UPI0021B5E903|nr:amidohydrolase family protein [Novosphingobium sp. 9]
MTVSPAAPGDEYAQSLEARGMPALPAAPARDRGEGPFERLVLRGATVIDGTGAPPWGPVDIVVENGRITGLHAVGVPGRAINPERRPGAGTREIDCHGKFVTPGFVDAHAHIGWPAHAARGAQPRADYIYKLWLAHGVTTVREMGSINGLGWSLSEKARAASHEIAAPRLLVHAYFPAVNDMLKTIHSPQQAREWVQGIAARGADGIKFFGGAPSLMRSAIEEANALGLRTGCHHAQQAVGRANAMTTAKWGLTSAEHFYGLPEALFDDRLLQAYPADYNYADEYMRFSEAGFGFHLAAQPGSDHWNKVLDQFLELDFTFVPTLGIYDANRDLMRARRADWHDEYTWPGLWDSFQPDRGAHGAHWFRWSTADEIRWKQNYQLWMAFINAYKNRGGRVAAGSDSGFIFQTYGFGFVRELEMLQEAGFHPLEVLRAATSQGADLMGLGDEIGVIDVGRVADLLVHDVNPLADFKQLYGTGAMRLDDENGGGTVWQRALRYTIREGLVYDVAELLADVRDMVAQERERLAAQ